MNKLVNGKLIALSQEELAQRELDAIKAQEEQAKQVLVDEKNNLLNILQSTDWHFVKQLDTGVEAPEQIKIDRANARTRINELEAQGI